jgi:hypothetical protein
MNKLLTTLLISFTLASAAMAAPIDGFPPDPKGGSISDRFYQEVKVAGKEIPLYASVWNPGGGKPAQVSIYRGTLVQKGMEWKKLHTWVLSDGGDVYNVSHSVLMAEANGDDEIQFWFKDWFGYVEGRASLVLHYYFKTGKFEFQLSD